MRLWGAIVLAAGCFAGGQSPANAADVSLANAQLFLDMLGFDAGPYDGVMGRRTGQALADFLQSRGKTYDGEFGADELDEIFAALDEVPYNGKPPQLSTRDGRTSYSQEFDFVPAVDLSAMLPQLTSLSGPDSLNSRLREIPLPDRDGYCQWIQQDDFPAAGQRLHTYSSFREFETVAHRNPHPGNRWVEGLQYMMSRAGPAVAATQDELPISKMKQALLAHSAAGSLLDAPNLMDASTRQVIVTPDFATMVIATQSLTINYLLARQLLQLSETEQEQVESWLNRLMELYVDSYYRFNGTGSVRDPRAVELIGRSYMIWGLLRNDPARFNEGARQALIALSLTREDGSHRFGASRGNRANWYQGVTLSNALVDFALLDTQGIDSESILLPTISRLADFWGRAWEDNSLFWPYARENNAVFVGSDYRVQEKDRGPSAGIEMILALAPDIASADLLREARAEYPYPTIFGETFNMSCLAAAYSEYAPPEPVASLTVGRTNVMGGGQNGGWVGYTVIMSNVSVADVPAGTVSFDVFTDFSSDVVEPENLILVRMVIASRSIDGYAAHLTDFANCSQIAFQPGSVRLHFGVEYSDNDCVLDLMTPADRELWRAVYAALPQILIDIAPTDPDAARLSLMVEHKLDEVR